MGTAPALALPEHPFFANAAMEPDPALLHALAARYRASEPAAPSPTRFLFGFAPMALFEALLTGHDRPPSPGALWILHLSGYFGGRWLRAELLRAQPNGIIKDLAVPADQAAFDEVVAAALPGLRAAEDDEAAVAHCRARLSEWAGAFGYNLGYLEQILEEPPAGVRPMPNFARAGGLLWCEIRTRPLPLLDGLWSVARRAGAPDEEPWQELCAPLAAIQEHGVRNGRLVWSTGLSVEGLPAEAYRELLELSAAFLAAIEATALTGLSGAGDARPDRARAAALADAALEVWQGSYALGLRDGRSDGQPPDLPDLPS